MGQERAPPAVSAFCAREWPRLVGALGLYTGDAALAEELAQEALTRACRDWGRVSGMEAPGAWVHRVAMNLAKSHFRRWRARRRAEARLGGDLPRTSLEPEMADVLTVRAAVAGLSPRRRAAVVLRFYLGYSTAETAVALGVAPATVRSLIHRALADLHAVVVLEQAWEADHE